MVPSGREYQNDVYLRWYIQDWKIKMVGIIERHHLETPPTLEELNAMLSTADKVYND